MKKTLKRLCTGFLALATVVTALPTTPVHAESKQDISLSLPASVQTQSISRTVSEIISISVWDWGVSAN